MTVSGQWSMNSLLNMTQFHVNKLYLLYRFTKYLRKAQKILLYTLVGEITKSPNTSAF